jgi:hypothetical protein
MVIQPKISSARYLPYYHKRFDVMYAPIAQLDRVTDYESVGRRFESCWAHHSQ